VKQQQGSRVAWAWHVLHDRHPVQGAVTVSVVCSIDGIDAGAWFGNMMLVRRTYQR
jgi:hypothetical protein